MAVPFPALFAGLVQGGNLFAELVKSGAMQCNNGMLGVSSHQQSSANANDANQTAAFAPMVSLGAKCEQQIALQRFGARMDCRDAAAASSRRRAKQKTAIAPSGGDDSREEVWGGK